MKIILIRQAEAGGVPADIRKADAAAYAVWMMHRKQGTGCAGGWSSGGRQSAAPGRC